MLLLGYRFSHTCKKDKYIYIYPLGNKVNEVYLILQETYTNVQAGYFLMIHCKYPQVGQHVGPLNCYPLKKKYTRL